MKEAVVHEVMSVIPPALRVIIYKRRVQATEREEGTQTIRAFVVSREENQYVLGHGGRVRAWRADHRS
jgi:hypothetical protein